MLEKIPKYACYGDGDMVCVKDRNDSIQRYISLEDAKKAVEAAFKSQYKNCKDCNFRKETLDKFGIIIGYCENPKICESNGQDDNDGLIYDYVEGGGFKVGDNFGCIHFLKKN